MLSALLIILRVLFIIFVVLVLLFLVLCSLRTGIEAIGVNGQVSIDFRYGLLRIPIFPLKKKKEKIPAAEEKKEDKPPRPSKERAPLNWRALQWGEIIDLLLTMLGELAGSLRISHLRVRILVGTRDAATTGIRLGQISAAIGMFVPFLENTFDMRDYRVSADADFNANHTEWAFRIFCSVRPIRLLFVVLRHGRELFRIYKQLMKKEEAIANEPAPNQ